MRPALVFVCCLFVAASESRKGRGRRIREEKENEIFDYKPSASYMAMTNMCTVEKQSNCCGDGVCSPPESEITCMADCPGVTTHETCGEEPHSDRSGKVRVHAKGCTPNRAGSHRNASPCGVSYLAALSCRASLLESHTVRGRRKTAAISARRTPKGAIAGGLCIRH